MWKNSKIKRKNGSVDCNNGNQLDKVEVWPNPSRMKAKRSTYHFLSRCSYVFKAPYQSGVSASKLRAFIPEGNLQNNWSQRIDSNYHFYPWFIIGWLCSSLRGNENKLYNFSDNLQGCGLFLESAVNISFKKMIQAIVQSMSSSKESDEIKCMLWGPEVEISRWWHDHSFLAEIDLFGILRGPDAQSLLRRARGKSLENKLDSVFTKSFKRIDPTIVRKLLELFEIIVVLCVGKVHGHHENQPASVEGKKEKLPSLERHISVIDEYSSEILIRQAFAVNFLELNEADKNYRNFSGLDWGAWQRAQKRKERKEEAQKKKTKCAKTTGAAGDEENVYYGGRTRWRKRFRWISRRCLQI